MVRRIVFSLSAVGLMLALLSRSAIAKAAVVQALSLCASSLLPSLFPFFVAVSFALNCGLFHLLRAVGIPTGPVLFLLGALGGYPTGGRTVGESYRAGLLDRDEAARLLGCCNNAGPAFILTVVGEGVFHDAACGAALLLIHLLAAAIVGVLLCRRAPPRPMDAPPPLTAAAFINAVKGAAEAMVHLCAFVVFFSVVMALLPFPACVSGLLELTTGITALPPHRDSFIMAAAFLGWGGVSVHAQTAAVLADSGLSLRYYFLGKILHGLLSAGLAWCALFLFYP